MTTAMGIAIVGGTVTLFEDYRSDVVDRAKEKQFQLVASKLKNGLYRAEASNNSEQTVTLPEEIGDEEYTVSIDENLVISSGEEIRKIPLNGISQRNRLEGSVTGEELKIVKTGDSIALSER